MPLLSGLEATAELAKCARPPKVIILTMNDDPGLAAKALFLGASAYVFKSRLMSDLEPAVAAAVSGDIYLSPTLRLPNT